MQNESRSQTRVSRRESIFHYQTSTSHGSHLSLRHGTSTHPVNEAAYWTLGFSSNSSSGYLFQPVIRTMSRGILSPRIICSADVTGSRAPVVLLITQEWSIKQVLHQVWQMCASQMSKTAAYDRELCFMAEHHRSPSLASPSTKHNLCCLHSYVKIVH